MPIIIFIIILSIYIYYQTICINTDQKKLTLHFFGGLSFKLLAGILASGFYKYYRKGDMLVFFNKASQLAEYGYDNLPSYLLFLLGTMDENITESVSSLEGIGNIIERSSSQNVFYGGYRKLVMIKIVSVACLLSGNNFWLSGIYVSFFSFSGYWFLFKKLYNLFPNSKLGGLIAFIYFPSIVFWSSSLIKEALVTGAIGFINGWVLKNLYIQVQNKRNILWGMVNSLLILILFYLVWKLKYYYILVWLGAFTPLIIVKILGKNIEYITYQKELFIYIAILFFLFLLTIILEHPRINIYSLLEFSLKNNDQLMASGSNNNLLIQYWHLGTNRLNLLINIPIASFQVLFRPFLWERNIFFVLWAALENTSLFLLVAFTLLKIHKIKIIPVYQTLVLALYIYIVIFLIFFSLSVPNLGTISRYRIVFLPYLIYILSFQLKWFSKFLLTKKI